MYIDVTLDGIDLHPTPISIFSDVGKQGNLVRPSHKFCYTCNDLIKLKKPIDINTKETFSTWTPFYTEPIHKHLTSYILFVEGIYSQVLYNTLVEKVLYRLGTIHHSPHVLSYCFPRSIVHYKLFPQSDVLYSFRTVPWDRPNTAVTKEVASDISFEFGCLSFSGYNQYLHA